MIYLVIGASSFFLVFLFELVSLKRIPLVKFFLWTLAGGLFIYAVIRLCLQPDKLSLPGFTIWLGFAMLPISLFFLIYALFVNLPFRRTYITTQSDTELITTGLYSLIRHPAVPALAMVLLSLILIFHSRLLAVATPIWILLDIILVVFEDRYILRRMFPGWEKYSGITPMLLPTKKSFHTFLRTFRK